MTQIKRTILIASGKGGVGKSTIATNVAVAMAKSGSAVGLLDADIYGPSIPTMLGDAERPASTDGKTLAPIVKTYGGHPLKLMSMGYVVDRDTAMIWRGPMLAGAVLQFVGDVDWGELDTLVFDLPPGTGDIQLSIAQKLKVTGAVLVTTPQEVALADVRRAKAMFDRVEIPTLGVVENMSYFVCPSCEARHAIFAGGGGERAATELDIPFIGGVPLEAVVREGGDAGEPVVERAPGSASARALCDIAAAIERLADAAAAARAQAEGPRRRLQIIQ